MMPMKICKICRSFVHGEEGDCEVCCNALLYIPQLASKVLEELKDYEFETFQVGCRLRGSARAILELLKFRGVEYDIKRVFNDSMSAKIESLSLKRRSLNPDIILVFDLEDLSFEKNVLPVYIYGRYIKRVRNISQTRWLCRNCGGVGCEVCNYVGKKYPSSVEEMISEPLKELFKAKEAVLHGAGREDVDARMLGNGRPFVAEIVDPKKRFLDLSFVEKYVNESCRGKVKVLNLRYSTHSEVEKIKEERHKKLYRAKVVLSQEVDEEVLKRALEELKGEIHQKTPSRVLHRRSDLLRIRKLYDAKVILKRKNIAVISFLADAGLYIKELVSGDNGRTHPSLAELLKVEAKVEKLDVLDVFEV